MLNEKNMLRKLLDRTVDNKKVFGTVFCIKHKGENRCAAAGNFEVGSRFFIASTTKLFVTALILKLRSEDYIGLDDRISGYLPESIMRGLHIIKGKEYSDRITVRNLLAHTSGIPDYFRLINREGRSFELDLIKSGDRSWTFEEAVAQSKGLEPLFIPGTKGKAHYSDTNFQLLGRIIETVTGKSIDDNIIESIFRPLQLTKTYMYREAGDTIPKTMYYKNREFPIPKAMTSFGPDGGIVSTAEELMVFLEAFFCGRFFPKEYIAELREWNRIFFPVQSGTGIHRFKLPWIFNPFGKIPELIGHSGLSGTIAYHSPEKDLFITGTVNQIAYPDMSFKVAVKLIQKVLQNS